jgi:hypothetical protein
MARRNYDFKFPDAEGNYWYLIWIGKIHYTKRQKKVELYFINTTDCSDLVRYFRENSIFKILVPVSYLAEFQIGMLYSRLEEKFISYEMVKSRNLVLTEDNLEGTHDGIPVLNKSYYSFLNEEDGIDIECMKYTHPYNNKVPVFITPYCIADYLFFRSDKLVNKVLSGELLDGFNLSKVNLYFDNTSNERVAEIMFDQAQIDKKDAFDVVRYLFLRDDIGVKFIKGIYSNLYSSLHNSIGLLETSAYLKFNLNPLSNYRISLVGKPHFVGEKPVVHLENRKSCSLNFG